MRTAFVQRAATDRWRELNMPDFMTPFDKDRQAPAPACGTDVAPVLRQPAAPPRSAWLAILRGMRGHCPRCDGASLFRNFLKPVAQCPACGQDWSHQRADDFPAYVAIFVTGHVMAPVIISLAQQDWLPLWGMMVLVLLLALGLVMATLQPAKGGIIALQWWFGMHGFKRGADEASAAEGEIG